MGHTFEHVLHSLLNTYVAAMMDPEVVKQVTRARKATRNRYLSTKSQAGERKRLRGAEMG
jgi:macrodomain Ter protein organizer (MatP/YcbG family)